MGVLAISSNEPVPDTDEECELDEEYLNAIYVDVDLDSPDGHEKIVSQKCTTRSGKRPMHLETRGRKCSRKADSCSQFTDAIRAFSEYSKLRSEARVAMMKEKEKRKQQEGKSATPYHEFSLPNCVIALKNLGAIDDNTYRLAMDKFVSADWREIFMSMSNARKKAWLDRLK
ncbi:uncharacterized protein LOC115974449 [Quercus lobata]|uniref:Uncharacterized protein n=1 Tax=Quercus lobata TaxID=97700 RepID=A0A7N2KSL2_QUELO|nr:uncharacterized protein LOC115974449 [Quercus lobata]XP_030950684.1 uncharacterized protein LOC115974449 [Quercus lobata]XP_030950685.1 uncharacterized protein LOC115974449 [Quercus lobata]